MAHRLLRDYRAILILLMVFFGRRNDDDFIRSRIIQEFAGFFLKQIGIHAFAVKKARAALKVFPLFLQIGEAGLGGGDLVLHAHHGDQPSIALNGVIEKITDNENAQNRPYGNVRSAVMMMCK